MRHGRMVYILGDVHADFGALNKFINVKIRNDKTLRAIAPRWKADGDDFEVIILQCGDFAYFWPESDSRGLIKNEVSWLPGGRVPIYWTGGNHEDWDRLDSLGTTITEVDRGIFYCPFASTLTLAPDVTVLFAGGAESADKGWRLDEMAKGCPKIWWEQEGVSKTDIERLAAVPRADWVVSHTCPASFPVGRKMLNELLYASHVYEPSRGKLEQVLVKYEPKRWFFGHFHHHMAGFTDGCDWECLDRIDGSGKCWDRVYLEWED